jgi:Tfp pilus assembly PilM family ATPase
VARYLAIDVDQHGLHAVSGPARAGAAKVEHALAWVPGADHGPPPLTVETARAVGEELRDRLKAAGVPAAPVLVAVGRDKVILKEVKHPPVPPTEEPAVVRFQVMKDITEAADDVVIDYLPLGPASADATTGDVRAAVVIVRKEVLAAVRAMCDAAGLKLAAVTPRPYAVAALLGQAFAAGTAPRPADPADSSAVLTLGPQGGEFTVVRNGQVVFTRSVPTPALADKVLLVAEVRRNLTMSAGQTNGHPVRAVYVAEPDELLGGWANKLDGDLPVPVHAFDPLVGTAPDVDPARRGRFAGAAGLLACKAAGLPINFAAPRQPKAEKDPNRKLYAYAAAAAAVLFLGGGALGYLTLAAADRKLDALQTEKADLEKLTGDAEPDRKRLEAVDQWAGRGVNYLDEMFDLADRFPVGDQVRATKVTGSAIRVDKAGKQEAQAKLDLLIGSKTPAAAAELESAFVRDGGGSAKYYIGTKKTQAGPGTTPYNQMFSLQTMVRHRPPAAYTRAPSFAPPRRVGTPVAAQPATPPPAAAAAAAAAPAATPDDEGDE